jgi:hypothetical protein
MIFFFSLGSQVLIHRGYHTIITAYFPFPLSTSPVELTLLTDFVSRKFNVYLTRSWTLGNVTRYSINW